VWLLTGSGVQSNGVMSSQSNNVVTFVWPPVHQNIELEIHSKILSLRRGLLKTCVGEDFSPGR
jgi:hypothetical protein